MKKLVKEKRLEFINGGWVSADEACPTYEEQIMNIMTGHAFLQRTFGITPKHAWHPDSFGHSAATPEIFARMGFETISFARIDDEEKRRRKASQEMEFLWQPNYEGLNGTQQSNRGIFVHVMHDLYNAPCGMDQYQGMMMDGQSAAMFENLYTRLEQNVETYINCLREVASQYKSNHILITAGMDFAFQYAHNNFNFLDKASTLFMDKTSSNPKPFKMYYSTLD